MQPLDGPSYALEKFEGPISLLLYLVRQQEIDVREIPVSALTAQYRKREAGVDEGAEFLMSASNLLWLKSCTLVPGEVSESLPEADFEALMHIAEYCRFKGLAEELGSREEGNERHYPRGFTEEIGQPDPLELSATELAHMLDELLKRAKPGKIEDEEYRVEDALAALRAAGDLRFDEVFSLECSRGELIVKFLAVLEMMKRQERKIVRREEEIWIIQC